MRADRLLTIIFLLQRRGRQRVTTLAERLEVSERTILRDMEALSAAGIPIVSVRGPGGGFELINGYRTDFSSLSDEECAAIGLLGIPGAAAALGLGREVSNLQLKMGLLVTERGREALRATAAQFFHDEPEISASFRRRLTFLRESIRRQRFVRFTAGDAGARGTVAPLGLVLQRGEWFLVSMNARVIEVHRVDSLSALSNTGERFERPANFDLQQAWRTYHGSRAADAGIDAANLGR